MSEERDGPRCRRLGRPDWALGALVTYFAASAIGVASVQALTWDLRAHARDPIDAAWRLELAWRAWRGDWASIDFHYPRGPLWQVPAWLAATLSHADPPWTLSLLYLAFHLSTLGLLLYLVLRHVPRGWARAGVFLGAAVLTNASGVATFRGFLPLLVIFAYAPRGLEQEEPRPWRAAFVAAGWTAFATLVSFDRLYAMGFCVAAMVLFEVAVRARDRESLRPAAARLGRYVAACAAWFGAVALIGLLLGADPVEAVLAQRRLAGAYSSHMATEWRVSVPIANVAGVFLVGAAFVIVPRLLRRGAPSRADGLWLAGALPAVSFGLIRADEGHMILSMIPALVVLSFLAGGAAPRLPWIPRFVAGVLAAIAVVGWFGTYPDNLAGNPRVFAELVQVGLGDKRPDRGYRSPRGAAIAWAREQAREHPDACIAASADMTVVHPFADVRGPTELAMRWSHEMKEALADSIREAACPAFVYSVKTYDYPGDAWVLGPDFVQVARMYELDEQLGPGLLGLRLRQSPRRVERAAVASEPIRGRLTLPGELRVPLDAPVLGTDVVDVELTLEMDTWRVLAGGAPLLQWRFERDGEPVSAWAHLYQVLIGQRSVVQLSPDPEAAEWRWMADARVSRRRVADTLAFRVEPRGLASPDAVDLEVVRAERLRLAGEPREAPAGCVSRRDLLDEVREGRAFVRYASPSTGPLHFDLEPSPPNQRLAEVVFDVVPCEDTCLFAGAAVEATEGHSDGVELEVHVLDLPDRVLLRRTAVPPGGAEVPLEVSLAPWAGRRVMLRLGTLPGEAFGDDFAKIVRPRLDRCSARAELAAAEELEVTRGAIERRGSDLWTAGGASLRLPVTVVRGTCFSTGLSVAGGGEAQLSVRVREGPLEHVVLERQVAAGEPIRTEQVALFDFTTRAVELVLDVTTRGAVEGVTLTDPRLAACHP